LLLREHFKTQQCFESEDWYSASTSLAACGEQSYLPHHRSDTTPWIGFQGEYKVNPLGPNPGLLIALHSPGALSETGLPMCPPEKGRKINAIRSRVIHPL
jgi:hypothetical protein